MSANGFLRGGERAGEALSVWAWRVATVAWITATSAHTVAAQSASAHVALVSRPSTLFATESEAAPTTLAPVSVSAVRAEPRTKSAPWWAPVASAVIPGAGQFALGQQRTVAYLVAEGYLVIQAVAAQRDGNRNRDEYRAIASDVARRGFGVTHPIGVWKYYETMEEYLESGVFDRIPGGVIDPETDESTYNGASWKLARENFWIDPESPPAVDSPAYQRALSFYVDRAIRDDYRWSWRDAQLQQDVYRQTIASANRTYQRAVTLVGLVGANHLASLIDAYVTVRVRRYGGVRVAGLTLDGVESSVRTLGDPAEGRRQLTSSLRFVAGSR